MISTPTPLSDDIEALKLLLANREALIAKPARGDCAAQRWQFGRSSERLDATLAQLQLALGDLPSAPPCSEPSDESLPAEDSTEGPPNKKMLPFRRAPRAFAAHLPRETIVHTPQSCNCPECGGAMRPLAKMCQRCSTWYRATSRSSAMCVRSSPAAIEPG